jgi:hypothetical protein
MPKPPQRRKQHLPDGAAESRGLVSLLAAVGADPAGQTGPAKFRMTLYTGEAMLRWNWRTESIEAIYLDVAGFKPKLETGWPAMVSHWSRAGTIDTLTADAKAVTIVGEGRFLANENDMFPDAARAQSILKQGHTLQCSGYWDHIKAESVQPGVAATVNGKTITGPAIIWRQFSMREGSFCDLGRDEMTSASLAASLSEEQDRQENPTMPLNLALLASLKTFVGADRAIALLAAKPEATDLTAFLADIEGEFTGLRAKLEQSGKDLLAAQTKVTTLETELAAAKKAPVVTFPGGDPKQPKSPPPGAGLSAEDTAKLTDAELTAQYEASDDLKAEFETPKHYIGLIRSGAKV